jgi:hypothetical protein
MINGLHGIFYTTKPDEAPAFLRDKVGLSSHDAGDGWLIFELPEGHIGCHPSDRAFNGISLSCDDLDATMSDLTSRGVTFTPVDVQDWGKTTTFELPGGGPVMVYQPTYAKVGATLASPENQ